MGVIIPLYVAANSTLFNTIISQKQAHPNVPMAVIVDINQGPGSAVNSAMTTTLNNLIAANITTIGYVSTQLSQVPSATVKTNIDNWFSFYNQGLGVNAFRLKGIYFGQMSNQTANASYYTDLQNYTRTTKGFISTVGGAGTAVPTSFLNNTCCDTAIVYEGAGQPLPANYTQYDNNPRNQVAVTPYGVATLNNEWLAQMSSHALWIYVTNDGQPNPWDTLPSYFTTLVSQLDTLGEGGSTGSSFDTFGIRKIYHTKASGEEWYVDMQQPTGDERFQNEPSLTHNNDGSWSCEGGSDGHQVRLEAWSKAYTDTTQRQNARWLNCEVTAYAKAETEYAQGGPYLFQWYARGGHHSANHRCEGSTLKGALWRRRADPSDPGLSAGHRKEICHDAYTSTRSVNNNAIPWTSTDFYNEWVGMKFIVYNIDNNTHTKTELHLDSDVQDNNGNLNAQNNWRFISSNVDSGGWFVSDSQEFSDECGSCGTVRDQIILSPGGNAQSGTADFNRNLAAWRTDDFRWRWKFLTVREIDPSKPATGSDPQQPPPEGGVPTDVFGVRKIYNTKTNGNEWFMASDPPSDGRFTSIPSVTINRNTDNISWKLQNTQTVTFYIKTPSGYNSGTTATNAANHAQCASRGFMQDAQDWRNVEITGYVRVNAVGPSPGVADVIWFARGGEHKDPQPNCEGSSMKSFLSTDGSTRFAKEQYHIAYNYTTANNQLGTSIVNRWVGYKHVVFNKTSGGVTIVRQEIYVDFNADNTWVKVDEKVDTGGWGTVGETCLGNLPDFKITWGGPLLGFRFDNSSNFDFKWLSIREIDGDAVAVDPPVNQNPGSCGT